VERVVVATTAPAALVARSDDERPVIAKRVVVAFVEVLLMMERLKMVLEAFTRMPRVVVGARYPLPCTDQSPNCDFQ